MIKASSPNGFSLSREAKDYPTADTSPKDNRATALQ
jgi:hypothetical protein